jgi:hypothetical protein
MTGLLVTVALLGLVAMARELPNLRRYLRIGRM